MLTGADPFAVSSATTARRPPPGGMSDAEIEQHKRTALQMGQQGKSLAEIKAYMDSVGVPTKGTINYGPGVDPNYVMGAITSAVHGASYGWDDEGIGSLYGLLTGQGAQAGRDFYRARLQEFHDTNPGTDLAMQIAGGALTGGAVAKGAKFLAPKALEWITTLPAWRAGLAAAGGGGAAYAAGDQEGSALDRLKATPGGALAGGIGGGLMMGGMAAAGAVMRPVMRQMPVLKKLFASPAQQADDVVAKDLLADKVDIPAAIEKVRQNVARGQPTTLADVAGENTVGRVAAIQSIPGPGKELIKSGLVERQQGSGDRIMDFLAGKTKLGLDNVERVRNGLLGARALNAETLYDEAYKASVPMTDQLKDLFRNPTFQKAWNESRVVLRETKGIDVGPLSRPFFPGGAATQTPGVAGAPQEVTPTELSVAGLDYTKRYLDRIVRSGFGKETGWDRGVAHGLNEKLKAALREVDELVPAYGTARKTYAGDSDVIDALDEGRKFLTMPADQIALKMQGYQSEAQREAYKLGVIEDIRDAIYNKKAKAPDVATTVLGGKEMQRRIRAVFGSDADDFLQRVRTEARFGEVLRGAASGSRTTPLAKVIEDYEQQNAGVIGNLLAGRPGVAMVYAMREHGAKLKATHTEQVAEELAQRYLYGLDDPAELIGYLMALQSRQPRTTVLPKIAAPLGGQFGAAND